MSPNAAFGLNHALMVSLEDVTFAVSAGLLGARQTIRQLLDTRSMIPTWTGIFSWGGTP